MRGFDKRKLSKLYASVAQSKVLSKTELLLTLKFTESSFVVGLEASVHSVVSVVHD